MKKPDSRYGGDPIYDEMSGFELLEQPSADGCIFLVGENLEKLKSDVALLDDLLNKTFDGIAEFSEKPMLYVGDHSIAHIEIAKDATESDVPRYPIKARYRNDGKYGAGFDPDEWIWQYVKAGKDRRATLRGQMEDSAEPSGYTCIATIKYLENGEIGWADYTIWRAPWLNYERFDVSFRRRKNELVVSKLEYRSDPDAQFERLYENTGKNIFIAEPEKFSWKTQKRTNADGENTLGLFGNAVKNIFSKLKSRHK